MFRRVNSIRNDVVRSIYPDLTDDTPEVQTSEEKESWRSASHRERQRIRDQIGGLRDQTGPSAVPKHGQTCIDAILLALRTVGRQEDRLYKLSAEN